MKKIISLALLIGLIILFSYVWRKFQHQKIIDNFDQQVLPLVQQMEAYDMLDLDLPSPRGEEGAGPSLADVDIEIMKDPDQFIVGLSSDFRDAVADYNASKGVWTKQGLPLELDVDTLLDTMSVEQKVAQLFIFGFDGKILSPGERSFLLEYQPGGVILMGKNISPELSQTIDDLQTTQEQLPLFVSIDQEGGIVDRIDEQLPSQPESDLDTLCATYTTRSDMLHDFGINMNFGIVADTTSDPDSFIYPRVFQGDISAKVAEAITCTTSTLSTTKHRPGHGATALDTHLGTAKLTITKSTREDLHLPPFQSGISAGSDLVMRGHLIADRLDPDLPSTLSRSHHVFLDSLGFDGLSVTDDMLMISGLTTRQTHLEQALTAGNDLILYVDPSPIGKTKIMDHAIQFVSQGGIDPDDLDRRVRKILEKKQKIISWGEYVPLELVGL